MAAVSSFLLAAGVAASAAGTFGQMSSSRKQNAIQQQMIAEEQKQEELRRRRMELDARRRSMEMVRNQQRQRAMSLAAATNQGASAGSGLLGGYGQISGQTGVNMLGVSQNLQLGQDMFASNAALSGLRMNYADAGSDLSMWKGVSSLGSTLFQAAEPANRLFGGGGTRSGGGYGGGMGYGQQMSWMGSNGIY